MPLLFKDRQEIILGSIFNDKAYELNEFIRNTDPYRSKINIRGSRNFHHEKITLKDLTFKRFVERLKGMLRIIGTI